MNLANMRMHVHVCAYMCTFTRTQAYMHICTGAHAQRDSVARGSAEWVLPQHMPSTYARTRAHTHAHTHACTHARMHAHTLACTHTHTHAHTHARTHAHMHARMHARTHMRRDLAGWTGLCSCTVDRISTTHHPMFIVHSPRVSQTPPAWPC